MKRWTILALAAAGAAMLGAGTAAADEAADFYRGKAVQMFIAGGAKGSYSYHVRVLQKYLTRHIAGNPQIVPQFMPGAGGVKAANFVYNAAPRDGTALGNLLKTIAVNEAIRRPGVKFKSEKFGWIVSTGPVDSVLALWTATSPARTLADAKRQQVILGSTGKGSATYIEPTLMNDLLGTKFKVITGYNGLEGVHLAVERGEVNGRFASWESLWCCKRDWLKQKKVVLLAQSGLVRNASLPDVPRLIDLATNEKDRKFLEFFGAASTLGRIYVTPPGVPKARLAALRKGFWAAVHDKEYVAEVEKRGLEYGPMRPADALKMARITLNSSPEVIARARKIMGTGKKKKKK